MWVTRALLKASPGYFAVNYPCPEKLPVHRTIQGLTLSSYQPLSSSAQGCIVWGFFPLSTAPTPASLLSFKLPAVTEMSLGLKMATVNSSSNLPFPKCFLGAHWQTLFQGAGHRRTLFPDLSSGPSSFLLPSLPHQLLQMNELWLVGDRGMRLCLFPASPPPQPGRFKAASYLDSMCAWAPAAWLP